MIITCPSCSARFRVATDHIGPEGRTVRCGRCSHTWRAVSPSDEAPLDLADPLPEVPLTAMPAKGLSLSANPVTATPVIATPVVSTPGAGTLASAPPASDAPVLRNLLRAGEGRVLEPRPVLSRTAEAPRRSEPRYDQPPPLSDPPPVDEDALFNKDGERKSRGNGWGATLLLIVLLFAAIAAAGWYWRDDIVAQVPEAAPIYQALGVPVTPAAISRQGIELANASFMPRLDNGQRKLLVTGLLLNPTDQDLPVPPLRISVLDQNRAEIATWTYQPDTAVLKAGARLQFESLHDHPDYGGTIDVEVTLQPVP